MVLNKIKINFLIKNYFANKVKSYKNKAKTKGSELRL